MLVNAVHVDFGDSCRCEECDVQPRIVSRAARAIVDWDCDLFTYDAGQVGLDGGADAWVGAKNISIASC